MWSLILRETGLGFFRGWQLSRKARTEVARLPEAKAWKSHNNFYYMLLVRESHKASLDSGGQGNWGQLLTGGCAMSQAQRHAFRDGKNLWLSFAIF